MKNIELANTSFYDNEENESVEQFELRLLTDFAENEDVYYFSYDELSLLQTLIGKHI